MLEDAFVNLSKDVKNSIGLTPGSAYSFQACVIFQTLFVVTCIICPFSESPTLFINPGLRFINTKTQLSLTLTGTFTIKKSAGREKCDSRAW
jgi:hypothetical protein